MLWSWSDMPDAKIEVKAGAISFSGEGSEEWISTQLDKVLAIWRTLPPAAKEEEVPDEGNGASGSQQVPRNPRSTLATFLKEKKATTNQVRKFLATALWLHDNQGKRRISTAEVTEALKSNNQGKLTNPGQCLQRNTTKGSTEKDGKDFYVTDEGREELNK